MVATSVSLTESDSRMPADLRDFDGQFWNSKWPDVRCPVCLNSVARPEKDSIRLHPSAKSDEQGHPAWEPEWIHGVFSGHIRCADSDCNEPVAVAGEYHVSEAGYNDYRDYIEYSERLTLRSALPALPLCVCPKGTPDAVKDQLDRASAVVWADPQSGANALRRAVEALVDAQGISSVVQNRKGFPRQVSLHERIGLLAANTPLAAEALEAVKWVGNEGSHAVSIMSATECVNAAEFLAFALKVLYDTTEADLLAKVRSVNAAKRRPKPPSQP